MKIQIVGEKITENLGFQLATNLVWLNCEAKLLLFGSAQKTGPLTTDRIQINHVENVFFNRGDTSITARLQTRKFGQAPMLLFLTPRQALSSHLRVFIVILRELLNFHPD